MVQTRKQLTAMQVAKEALSHDAYVLILAPTPPPAASFFARCTEVSHEFARAVEEALRLRHPNQPAQLPHGFNTWLQKLLFDERRSEIHVPALSVGTAHAATVHAGRVFVWGTEYVSMQGRECPGLHGYGMRNTTRHVFDNDIRDPTPLANVTSAVSVSCGREHTLVLSSDGSVHTFGNGEWGQCGTAKGRAKMDHFPDDVEPTHLRGKPVLTNCATFGLLKNGYLDIDTLYSIEGDLPYMHCAECQPCIHPPRQISGVEMAGNYPDDPTRQGHPYGPFGMVPPVFVVPVPRPIFTQLKVLQVSAGSLHSLVLCEDHCVYAFGCAYDGRLGIGDTHAEEEEDADDEDSDEDPDQDGLRVSVHRIEPVKLVLGALGGGARVIDVSAGEKHSLAVRSDGKVATWGMGLLGDGCSFKKSDIPILVSETPTLIRHASAGFNHSLLVGSDGSVYSFGCGEGGCLGFGADEEDVLVPTKIDLAGVTVCVAAAGETHSLVLDTDGKVYEFGFEASGRLGWSDDDDDDEDEVPKDPDPRGLPKLIEDRGRYGWDDRSSVDFFKGLHATDIAAGGGTTAIRSVSGLATFGGCHTDSFPTIELNEWPGTEQVKMIEAIAEKDEEDWPMKVEHPMYDGGCVIS